MQNERRTPPPSGGINAQDILLIVFKHKWMILILTLLGLGAAAYLYKKQPVLYASKAKIFVRYIVERAVVDDWSGSSKGGVEDVISAEIAMLTSRDIALEVADRVGAETLIPSGSPGDPLEAAAGYVSAGLVVQPSAEGKVLEVSYQNEDPSIVQTVLTAIIEEYKEKHFAVHRTSGSLDFVTKRVDVVRMRMEEAEKALDELRKKAGVISLPERRASLDKAYVEMQQQLLAAEGDLAVQKAVVAAAKAKAEVFQIPDEPVKIPTPEIVRKYRLELGRLDALLSREEDLSQVFLAGHPNLIRVRSDIQRKNDLILQLEQDYPGLVRAVGRGDNSGGIDPMELARQEGILQVIQQKVDRLNNRIEEIVAEGDKLAQYGPEITELERRLEVDQQNYMYFQSALEKARVDGALDPSRAPNLEVIEHPTPPKPQMDEKMQKIILALAGSGLAMGLGLAFIIELFLKRGIRKPQDLETELHIPLLLAIPNLPKLKGGAPLLELKEDSGTPALMMSGQLAGLGMPGPDHMIEPYTDAIRDRLVFHFEMHNMRHKPKLVAFTGLSGDAGTSTLAAGVAHAFAEEEDARVLLVDMGSEAGEDSVYEGVQRYTLPGALGLEGEGDHAGTEVAPEENLVVAHARSGRARDGEFGARSLYELMPNLRASDYDYIIFDMPPVDMMSPTLAMAGLMDKVLLVLDSGKTDRDVLKRRYSELASGKAHVSCIYNKAKRHAPKWVQGEI